MRRTAETFGIIAWLILGILPLHAEEGGIKPNWKETSFQLNDNVRLDVDGYAYIGPFYTSSPPAVSSSSTYNSAYRTGEVVTGYSVANGGRTIRRTDPYPRGNEYSNEYARTRPWFHLYMGENFSFHARADFMTGRIGEGENYRSENVMDFGYFELKAKGFDLKLGMISFADPLDEDWYDPTNFVLANNGGFGIAGDDEGRYRGHRADGYEGVMIATDDVFLPWRFRVGYFNMGHRYMSDEVNLYTGEALYRIGERTKLRLYHYSVLDKDNTQFPGLGGKGSKMHYSGFQVVRAPDPLGFSLNAVYLGGETNLQSRSLNRSAYAMHTTLDMRLAKDATAGLKFTHTSGDNDPYDRKDSAFWGYDADYYETYMFYDYGWAETLNYEPTVIDPHTGTKLGMYLFGPYLKTSLPFISEKLKLDAGIYQIFSAKQSPVQYGGNGNRNVGTEFDATFEYFITKHLSAMLELDYINVGNLYDKPGAWGRSPNAWMAGAYMFYYF